MRHFGGEFLGARLITAADQGALEVPGLVQDTEMGAGLAVRYPRHPGPWSRAREEFSGDRGGGGGAEVGKVVGGDDQAGALRWRSSRRM